MDVAQTIPEIEIDLMKAGDIELVLQMWWDLLQLTADVNDRYRLADEALDHQRLFFERHLDHETAFCFVAKADGAPVGFANGYIILPSRIFRQVHIGLIENLYVDPDLRRAGLGTRLVASCYGWFEGFGVDEVYVNVVPANEASKKFWTAMGYTVHKQTMAKSFGQE